MILGIDPGLDGAFALIRDNGAVEDIWDMPTLELGGKKATKRDYDEHGIASRLRLIAPHIAIAGVERLGAFPGARERQTLGSVATSNFRLGLCAGILRGQLAALGIRFELVAPQSWKAALMKGMPKEKSASILRAKQLFPDAAGMLTRKKDDGRADAILIAEYVRRMLAGAAA